ncbi:minor extracellular protease vpr [Apiospora arundinis]
MLFLVLVSIGAALAVSVPAATHNETQSIVAKKFIIEAEEGVSIESLTSKVESTGAKVLKTFVSDVFTGLSVETEDDVNSLQANNEVRGSWPIGSTAARSYSANIIQRGCSSPELLCS